MMIPRFVLIIGTMKSGTTTLFDLLAAHPAIAPAVHKESAFFALEERFSLGWSWYEDLFSFNPATHVYGLDGSTDYTKYPFADGVVDRLKDAGSERFKLIMVMRHPLRRIESHARHVQRTRKELGQNVSDRPDHSLDHGVSPLSLAIARYADQISQYQDWFDRGDLLLLSFEDLMANQSDVMNRVATFLDLPPITLDAPKASNRAEDKRQSMKIVETLGRFEFLKVVARALVPTSLRRAARRRLTRKVTLQGRFKLTPEEERDILAELAPDLKRLREDYNFDTERWWGLS